MQLLLSVNVALLVSISQILDQNNRTPNNVQTGITSVSDEQL